MSFIFSFSVWIPLFLFLLWLLCLGLSKLCWIIVVRVGTLVLFLSLEEHFLFYDCNLLFFSYWAPVHCHCLYFCHVKNPFLNMFTPHLHKRGIFSLQFIRRKAYYMPFLRNTDFQPTARGMLLTKYIRVFLVWFFFFFPTLSFIIPLFHKSFIARFQSII